MVSQLAVAITELSSSSNRFNSFKIKRIIGLHASGVTEVSEATLGTSLGDALSSSASVDDLIMTWAASDSCVKDVSLSA